MPARSNSPFAAQNAAINLCARFHGSLASGGVNNAKHCKKQPPPTSFSREICAFFLCRNSAPRKAVGAEEPSAPRAENVSAPAYGASEHTSPFSCKSTERAGASAGRTAEAVKALACEPTERVDASASGETEVVKALACGAAERVSASANGETEVVKAFSCRAAERANRSAGGISETVRVSACKSP